MAASETTHKCAHEACSCKVPEGTKYCSDYCKKAPAIELRCACRHPGCEG